MPSKTRSRAAMLDLNTANAAGWDASNKLKTMRRLSAWTDVEADLGCAVTNYLCAAFQEPEIAALSRAHADELAADLVAHGVHVRPNGSWTYRPLPSAA